jgi:hypothetical protein
VQCLKAHLDCVDDTLVDSEEEDFKVRMVELHQRQGGSCATCELSIAPPPDFDGAFDRPFTDSARLLCVDCSEISLSFSSVRSVLPPSRASTPAQLTSLNTRC